MTHTHHLILLVSLAAIMWLLGQVNEAGDRFKRCRIRVAAVEAERESCLERVEGYRASALESARAAVIWKSVAEGKQK